MQNFAEICGNLSYALVLLSFLVRSMTKLRIISIFASLAGIYYSAFSGPAVMHAPIFWSSIFITTNVWQLVVIYLASQEHDLSEEEKFLHRRALHDFSSFEVKSLLKIASRRALKEEEKIIRMGGKARAIIFNF